MNRIAYRVPIGALLLLSAAPALADHMGPSGFGGGGMTVFGPDTLDGGHWAGGLRFTYTKPEQRSDAELEALAAEHVHAHNTDDNLNASASVAYGISHHLTVSAELPYVRRDDLREGEHSHVSGTVVTSVEELGSVAGIGDLNLLAKYRVTEGTAAGFALIGGLKMPTGSTDKRSPDGERLETEHQPGSGSWDPILGASASAKLGPVQLTSSALYQISTKGAQQTRLGNRLQGGIALSYHFGERPHAHESSVNHHHGDELDEEHEHATSSWDGFVELAGEWEGRQRVGDEVEPASGGKWLWVAPGARFHTGSGWSLGAAIAMPLWQRIRASHPDNRYRLTIAVGKAF
jgi:hypothetical protein